MLPITARAVDFNVGNSDAYVTALIDIARNPGRTDTLNFTGSFAITATGLPSLAKDAGQSLTVNGNGFSITSSTVRPFFVDSGVVNISNLTISNALARGGAGGTGYGGGGGGLGAGGALFVNTGAQVTLDNVGFTNNMARGGNGGGGSSAFLAGGGGGGLGGAGGTVANGSGGGGGGGFYGTGGNGVAAFGAGGGGGELGAGGNGFGGGGGGGRFGNGGFSNGAGGGGGGITGNGGVGNNAGGGGGAFGNGPDGGVAITPGAAGGGGNGGALGGPSTAATSVNGGGGGAGVAGGGRGGDGGAFGGGGGGGANDAGENTDGGTGGTFGGGGGAARAGTGSGIGGTGGRFGGGGGGSGQQLGTASTRGGTSGSFGGGGGGGADGGTGASRGGDGGPDGGGGGGGGIGVASRAGNGGFGSGGGGINELTGAGTGGAFGGNGATSAGTNTGGGGGGAGLGGAIFVAQGGQLTVRGLNLSGNQVMAGMGAGGGGNGQTSGAGIFLRNQSLTFDVASGTTANLSQEIAGTGANAGIVKQGAGTLALGGTQTFPGLTTVTAGTLRLTGSLAGGASLTGGTFDVASGGTVGGAATVTGGLLTVNGTVVGAVNIGAAGRLQGTGRVGATTVFGTLAPGNSIGTITMDALNLAAGSMYEVEIDASGAADRTNVTGTTQLGGTAQVLAAPGNYTNGQRFLVISSVGAVTGAFTSITDDLAAFNVRALIIGNDVFFELFRSAIGITPNQISVENVLALGRTGGNADLTAVLAVFDALPEATGRVALDSMAGEIYAALPNAYLQDFSNYSDMVQRRLWTMQRGPQSLAFPREGTGVAQSGGVGGALALAAPMGMPNACDPAAVADSPAGTAAAAGNARLPGWRDWTAWGRAHGYEQDIDADGNAARQDIDASGATFGADRPWGDRAVVGFTAGFTDLDLDIRGRGQSADIDTYRAGVYGTLNLKHHWYATGLASYAHHDVRSRRQIALGTLARNTGAGFDADGLGLYGEAGRTFHWGKVLLRPHAALRFATVDQDALAEGGAGSLDLRVNSIDQDLFTGIAGLWATRPWVSKGGTLLVPELRLRYLHELESDRRSASAVLAGVPNAPFTVLSNGAGRDGFVAGLGLTAKVKDDLAVFASYDGQFHSHADAHAGEAGVRFSW